MQENREQGTETFVIEGRNAVLEAFRSGRTIDKIYAVSYTHLADHHRLYDLIIKTMVVGRGNRPVHRLHEETSQYVQASAQSFMMRSMQEHLNEEEHGVYRRGRNARSVSPAKNQSITDYRRATGFEALIGHLYLTGQYERLTELVSIGLESIEKEIKEKGAEHAGK